MRTLTKVTALAPLLALGCASTAPSKELVDARRNYEQARATPESRYAPDRLLEAKQALDRAEHAHDEDAGSFDEKSLAYIASRRAQLAVLYGKVAEDQQRQANAEQAYKSRNDELRRSAEQRAAEEQRKLEATRNELGMLKDKLAGTREELEQARAHVTEEPRGVVITLSGAVLFASAKSQLLPTAERKLDDVAKALQDVGPDQQIVVEGYTDSQGSDDFNQRLSAARAESVRDYLIRRGIASSRIRAVGKGEASPVASNDTPEGRADNRRVEIVLLKQGTTPGSESSQSSQAPQSSGGPAAQSSVPRSSGQSSPQPSSGQSSPQPSSGQSSPQPSSARPTR
jgi:outer membrane protein OmpA-like peptidoglycan-associated protein